MTIGKVFRSIVSKIEISKITELPVITETSSQSHMTSGYTILNIITNIYCSYLSIIIKLSQSTDMMLIKGTIVM